MTSGYSDRKLMLRLPLLEMSDAQLFGASEMQASHKESTVGVGANKAAAQKTCRFWLLLLFYT
jgi:hypothetical protein